MATLKFFIRTTKKEGTANLRIRFTNGRDFNFYATTKLVVPIEAWDNNKQYFKSSYKYSDESTLENAKIVTEEMGQIENYIFSQFNSLMNKSIESKWLEKTIENYYNRIEEENKKSDYSHVTSYIHKFIEECRTGKRYTEKNTPYTKNTLLTYRNVERILSHYETYKDTQIMFDDIDINFYKDFVHYLYTVKNLKPNTVGMIIIRLKTMLRESLSEDIHNNPIAQHKNFKGKLNKIKTVYMDKKKIEKLSELADKLFNTVKTKDVSNLPSKFRKESIVRLQLYAYVLDRALLGYLTGQRYSDFSKISLENIINIDGDEFLQIKQEKTQSEVIIPLFDSIKKILIRLPEHEKKVNNIVDYNRYIKDIMRLLEFNEIIKKEYYENGRPVTKDIPFYDLVTSHICRRSFVTNAQMDNVSNDVIMSITGHKSEANVRRYNQADEIKKANAAKNNPSIQKLAQI